MGLPFKDVGGDIMMLLILCVFYTFIGIAVGMLRDGVRLRAMFRPKHPRA